MIPDFTLFPISTVRADARTAERAARRSGGRLFYVVCDAPGHGNDLYRSFRTVEAARLFVERRPWLTWEVWDSLGLH